MRILLAQNSLYYPSHGGGDKSNRLLMEALAARGHDVRVVARVEQFGREAHDKYLDDLRSRGVSGAVTTEGVHLRLNGVDVLTVTLNPQFRAAFAEKLTAFDPDVIITSTDDPAQLLFEIAIRSSRARVVHLVRATIAVPFGPDSSSPSATRTGMLRQADAVVGVSEYVARYVREHGKMDAVHVPISLMDREEPAMLGNPGNRFVALVNPCAVKGISIFTSLAAGMPEVAFAAVPTWGTNALDYAELRRHANLTIIPPSDKIDDILRQTRVLLVPSLWAEARSRIIVEAMARGVPVIASDIGGIPEAKLGVEYLIPVNPIFAYEPAVDEHMVPVAKVPPQNIAPWREALERLIGDETHYCDVSLRSRDAALGYIASISVEPFERILARVIAAPKRGFAAAKPPALSPERQRLLALRLKRKSAGSGWFAGPTKGKPVLLCFPHAGAGTVHYRGWQEALPGIALCPIRLPGRETRMQEPPMDDMRKLVKALAPEIEQHVQGPFAFFGHSMGAGIAFEIARGLRRRNAAMPAALFVSAARAPQWRLGYQPPPEPEDAELVEQLARLGSMSPEMLRLALPVLRADTRLYRNYVYQPEDPLPVSLHAYGGEQDDSVPRRDIEAWREQAGGAFRMRIFSGGHFYLQENPAAFLSALQADLRQAGVVGPC